MTPSDLALAERPTRSDAAPPVAAVPVDRVLSALADHGFVLTATDSHVVANRDRERVVVPTHSPDLPAVLVRRLDWSLGATLGHGRLMAETAGPEHGRSIRPVVRLRAVTPPTPDASLQVSAVVEQAADDQPWCSFLLEEPSIMGHGPTPAAALVDVGHAAEAWLGTPAGAVAVVEVRRPSSR